MLKVDRFKRKATEKRGSPEHTKSEVVYQELRKQILNSDVPAGSIVSEQILAEKLSVGKAPVRVAIRRLASEGLLSIEPRRGIRISEQSVQDVLDLFQVRILMEQLVVRQIAGKLSPLQIDRLRQNLVELRVASMDLDIDKVIESDFGFHRLLAEFHANKQLVWMLDRTFDSLYREVRSSMLVRNRASESLGEHEKIYEAIVSGDADEADRCMVAHVQCGQRFVMSRGVCFS